MSGEINLFNCNNLIKKYFHHKTRDLVKQIDYLYFENFRLDTVANYIELPYRGIISNTSFN